MNQTDSKCLTRTQSVKWPSSPMNTDDFSQAADRTGTFQLLLDLRHRSGLTMPCCPRSRNRAIGIQSGFNQQKKMIEWACNQQELGGNLWQILTNLQDLSRFPVSKLIQSSPVVGPGRIRHGSRNALTLPHAPSHQWVHPCDHEVCTVWAWHCHLWSPFDRNMHGIARPGLRARLASCRHQTPTFLGSETQALLQESGANSSAASPSCGRFSRPDHSESFTCNLYILISSYI